MRGLCGLHVSDVVRVFSSLEYLKVYESHISIDARG